MEQKKLLLVVNPVAGRIRVSEAFFEIVKTFNDGGYSVTVHMTKERGEAARVTAQRGSEYDLIVFCGGDGTLNEGVTGLLRGSVQRPIGYIPCGTTNDFAAGLGLERDDLVQAARNIVAGKSYTIDVGMLEGRYFNYIASFGAFTDTSYSAPQATKNAIGHLAYILEGLRNLPNIRPVHAVVKLDGETVDEEFIFVAVTNATSIGGVLKLDSDKVDFSDGEFEVMLVRNPTTALELSREVVAIQTGRYEDSGIRFCHTSRVSFTFDNDTSWALDGEQYRGGKQCDISVLKHAVTIIG